jgi:hypothetical protein
VADATHRAATFMVHRCFPDDAAEAATTTLLHCHTKGVVLGGEETKRRRDPANPSPAAES